MIPIPIPEFPDLPFIPTGDFREVARDPGDAIHILRSAVSTSTAKAPGRSIADVAGGKLGRESDLVILSSLKGFDHKIGNACLRRSNLAQPDMGQCACLDQGMKESFLPHPFNGIHHCGIVQVGGIRIIDFASRNISFDNIT